MKKLLLPLALISMACVSEGPKVTKAHSWVGYRIIDADAVYDGLPKSEKMTLRDEFKQTLAAARLPCPLPQDVETIMLEETAQGVTGQEMMDELNAALLQVNPELTVEESIRDEYECIGGKWKCKHTFNLLRNGAPLVDSFDSSAGVINAVFDLTLVWNAD